MKFVIKTVGLGLYYGPAVDGDWTAAQSKAFKFGSFYSANQVARTIRLSRTVRIVRLVPRMRAAA